MKVVKNFFTIRLCFNKKLGTFVKQKAQALG